MPIEHTSEQQERIPNDRHNNMPGERIVLRDELHRMIPVSSMTVWRWEKDGKFPKRFRLSDAPNARRGWLESEVLTWIANRAAARCEEVNRAER